MLALYSLCSEGNITEVNTFPVSEIRNLKVNKIFVMACSFYRIVFFFTVRKASFRSPKQFGDPRTTESRAFLQDVSGLYPCCKTFFTIPSEFIIL